MKEIPILYSTPMIRAKLAGRKTQTRRIVKLEKEFAPDAKLTWGYTCFTPERHISVRGKHANGDYGESFIKCPYGKPGDILWARETWSQVFVTTSEKFPEGKLQYRYKADHKGMIIKGHDRFKPSIHMPKIAARIWDRVVSVRIERLQDISEEDAIAEGIEVGKNGGYKSYEVIHSGRYKGDKHPHAEVDNLFATISYKELWESINGPGSWEANPWVWVITTETLSTTGKPTNQ